jgi:hypothetical protein
VSERDKNEWTQNVSGIENEVFDLCCVDCGHEFTWVVSDDPEWDELCAECGSCAIDTR